MKDSPRIRRMRKHVEGRKSGMAPSAYRNDNGTLNASFVLEDILKAVVNLHDRIRDLEAEKEDN